MQDFFEKYAERIMPEPMSGCWIWFWSQTTAGYGNFTRNGKTHYAHQCAFDAVHGNGAHVGIVVRHQCDFKPRCNPDHLLGGTAQDNVDDAWARDRMRPLKGEAVHTAILTEEVVIEARRLAASGMPVCDVAKAVGFSWKITDLAIRGVNWKHIQQLPTIAPVKAGFRTKIPHGEKAYAAILTQADVNCIRDLISRGANQRRLAYKYEVSESAISAIKHGRTWGKNSDD